MSRRLFSVILATALFTGLAAAPALGDMVGEPGTPGCFGERIGHGSSDHGLTPVERAEGLQTFIVEPALTGAFGEEIRLLVLELFGDDGVSVKETMNWIRINCSDEPLVGP